MEKLYGSEWEPSVIENRVNKEEDPFERRGASNFNLSDIRELLTRRCFFFTNDSLSFSFVSIPSNPLLPFSSPLQLSRLRGLGYSFYPLLSSSSYEFTARTYAPF